MSNGASELVHDNRESSQIHPEAAGCPALADTAPVGDTQGSSHISKDERRQNIMALEAAILKCPQVGWETFHHFAPGVYVREVRIKKDHVVTGAIHKKAHLNILSQGEIAVETEDGMKRIKAPAVIHSMPGIKRAGYAIEDTVWLTVCHNPADETDIPTLEAINTAKTFQELEDHFAAQKQITQEEV